MVSTRPDGVIAADRHEDPLGHLMAETLLDPTVEELAARPDARPRGHLPGRLELAAGVAPMTRRAGSLRSSSHRRPAAPATTARRTEIGPVGPVLRDDAGSEDDSLTTARGRT